MNAKKERELRFSAVWEKAERAAMAAGTRALPTPMVVSEHANMADDSSAVVQSWHVPEGVCGFAWVTVHPGNSPFANWLKKQGHATKAYGGGVWVWISEFGQSYERKMAAAGAMAAALATSELGEGSRFYAEGRLD